MIGTGAAICETGWEASSRPLLPAARLLSDWMPLVVAAALVFAFKHLVSWGGYLLGPLLRTLGMAATFAINVSTLAAAIYVWWP